MRRSFLALRRSRSWRKKLLVPALWLLLLELAPAVARSQGAGADSVVLSWTAPGDDGNVGTAASYEIRMANAPITSSNWSSASVVPGAPAPQPAGTRQRAVVRGLSRGTTYYFAMKASDEADNQSALSNVVRWDWVADKVPPGTPRGVAASAEDNRKVRIHWSANSESDLAGYTVYRSTDASGPFTPVSGLITATQFVDSAIPDGAATVWYEVTASDQTGNESSPSSASSVDVGIQVSTSWTLETGYPNPSRLAASVNIPVIVPPTGSQGAALQILDSGGHLVRRLDLSSLSTGPQSVAWDGRNQAGGRTAPGVYTAWLVGVGDRRSVKLVRVP
ncbi:MAG TPA: FlgD immunoglobulin-like domain containing protein [Candidatus Eisenbacteria bacterium]|jgi:hypothetical protein